jgi:hypothetical protein
MAGNPAATRDGSPMSALDFDGGCAPGVGFCWSRSGCGTGRLGGAPLPGLSGLWAVVFSSATLDYLMDGFAEKVL